MDILTNIVSNKDFLSVKNICKFKYVINIIIIFNDIANIKKYSGCCKISPVKIVKNLVPIAACCKPIKLS